MTTTFPSGPGSVEARPSWREERRLDRLAQADADERRADARQQREFAAADKTRQLRAADRAAKRAARISARQDRGKQWEARGKWCRRHAEALVMIPVIGVPGGLAWTGMADYGYQQYGMPGLALPAFSEAAMWVFAMRTTATRRRDPGAPIWHLRLGTAVFTGYSGALNFLHGFAAGGVVSGVTMALVSMAGVIAHQITTAGPRKTRQQRSADRIARKAARKAKRAEAAAIAAGIVVIGADGRAEVTVRPGAASLRRRWPLRSRLVPDRDVQAEIDDITGTALLLVDRAGEAASQVRDQAGRIAEAAREARQQAAQQTEAAEAAQAAAEERAQDAQRSAEAAIAEARERARSAEIDAARRIGEVRDQAAAAIATAQNQAGRQAEEAHRTAEAALARASAAEERAVRTETEIRARLERASREAAQRVAQAETARDAAVKEADRARAANQSAAQALEAARWQADRARDGEQAAAARAAAAEAKIAQAEARQKRPGETKKDHLLRLYRAHPDYGIEAASSKTATELAGELDYSPGSARRDVRAHLIETGVIAAAEDESENAA